MSQGTTIKELRKMGMAASQARLLCLTARIHDVEYQAQMIQQAKTTLATAEHRAWQEYNAALEDQTLTISTFNNGNKVTIPATFNTLCSKNRVKSADGSEYAIVDRDKKQLVVEDDIYNSYIAFTSYPCSQDAYTFAMYMISGDKGTDLYLTEGNEKLREGEEVAYNNATNNGKDTDNPLYNLRQAVLSVIENAAKANGVQKPNINNDIYDPNNYVANCKDQKIREQYKNALDAYKKELYSNHADDILAASDQTTEDHDESYDNKAKDFDKTEFNYYVNIFKQIKTVGGCCPISDYNGFGGDAANDTEWLEAMIMSGVLSIEVVETDEKTGHIKMDMTSPSTDSSLSFTPTSDVDSTALKKAEAKYEKTLKDIDRKDKQYDLTLSKLETERSALKTQYDSVKKVIQDNIERTFGIFS